jgi:hypothetical protein
MEKTIYSERVRLTKQFLESIINEQTYREQSYRKLICHIIEQIPFSDLQKLGFELEYIDPVSEESLTKVVDNDTSEYERAFLFELYEKGCIEMRVKLLL